MLQSRLVLLIKRSYQMGLDFSFCSVHIILEGFRCSFWFFHANFFYLKLGNGSSYGLYIIIHRSIKNVLFPFLNLSNRIAKSRDAISCGTFFPHDQVLCTEIWIPVLDLMGHNINCSYCINWFLYVIYYTTFYANIHNYVDYIFSVLSKAFA